jgi:hypothetical protein
MTTEPLPDPAEKVETEEIIILHELLDEVREVSRGIVRRVHGVLPDDERPTDPSKSRPPSPPADLDPRP